MSRAGSSRASGDDDREQQRGEQVAVGEHDAGDRRAPSAKPTTSTTASGDQPVGLAALRADQRAERAEPDVADHEQRRDDDDQQHPQPVAALHLVAEGEDRRQDDAGGARGWAGR